MSDSNRSTPTNETFKVGGKDHISRNNGMIRYDSPSFGGVYGSLSHAFDQCSDVADKQTVPSLQLGYKTCGLNVAQGYQGEKTAQQYTVLAASYGFCTFSISGGSSSVEIEKPVGKTTNDTQIFAVGVRHDF